MPDSLLALAILAVVGLPGYAYKQLVPDADEVTAKRSELGETLEVVFFGLACALVGLTLSLVAQPAEWTMLLQAATDSGADVAAAAVESIPLLVPIVLLGAFTASIGLAGLVRFAKAREIRSAGMVAGALTIGIVVTLLLRGPAEDINVPTVLWWIVGTVAVIDAAVLSSWVSFHGRRKSGHSRETGELGTDRADSGGIPVAG